MEGVVRLVRPWTRNRSERFETEALPHLPALLRMARQLAGPENAEDLTQESYLRAWKYFDSFDPATNCRAWLFRILRNCWISRWRKARLELPLGQMSEEPVEPYYDWEDEFLQREPSAEVQEALAALPGDYRMAVLLADVEEFTYKEIAQILECPIGTVMSRLNRGRRMLGRLLRARQVGRRTPTGMVPPEPAFRRKP